MRVAPPGLAPACTLVRELMRLVEVKVVDHVAIRQRLKREKVGDAGVVGAGGDDRVARGGIANGCGKAGLNTGPAISIVDFRLVENLKEDTLRVAIGVVRGQPSPKH